MASVVSYQIEVNGAVGRYPDTGQSHEADVIAAELLDAAAGIYMRR